MSARHRRPVDAEAVAELTRRGWSVAAIAAHLDCAPRSVTRVRSRLGIAKPKPRWLTSEEIDRAEAMLADGCSVAEIERTLGRTQASLYERFKGRHWTHRQAGQWAAVLRQAQR